MTEEQRAKVRQGIEIARTGWRQTVREVCWVLGLGDENHDPSLSRAFCALFALAAVHGTLFHEKDVTWPNVAMGFLAVCGYFGLAGLRIFGRAAQRGQAAKPDAGPG